MAILPRQAPVRVRSHPRFRGSLQRPPTRVKPGPRKPHPHHSSPTPTHRCLRFPSGQPPTPSHSPCRDCTPGSFHTGSYRRRQGRHGRSLLRPRGQRVPLAFPLSGGRPDQPGLDGPPGRNRDQQRSGAGWHVSPGLRYRHDARRHLRHDLHGIGQHPGRLPSLPRSRLQ